MNINILLSATTPIPLHAFSAITAIILGAIQLTRQKGTPSHRILGYLWVVAMIIVCLSSFFIHTLPVQFLLGWSPIHLLSIWTLISIWWMLYHARKKQIIKHKRWATRTYFLSLIITGFFTFYPGRIMYQVFFGT